MRDNEPEQVPGGVDDGGDLDAFVAALDRALTATFGPDHQRILSAGPLHSEFVW